MPYNSLFSAGRNDEPASIKGRVLAEANLYLARIGNSQVNSVCVVERVIALRVVPSGNWSGGENTEYDRSCLRISRCIASISTENDFERWISTCGPMMNGFDAFATVKLEPDKLVHVALLKSSLRLAPVIIPNSAICPHARCAVPNIPTIKTLRNKRQRIGSIRD